jgi:hypothetical protein
MIDPLLTPILVATALAIAIFARRVKAEGDQKAREFREYLKSNYQHKSRGHAKTVVHR